jgi:hypothetical protein
MTAPKETLLKRWELLTLVATVLLFGMGFHQAPVHAIHPSTQCILDPACTAGEIEEASTDAQNKLRLSDSRMVVALGLSNWDSLEVCTPNLSATPPTGEAGRNEQCFFDSTGTQFNATSRPCLCYFDLRTLEAYLDQYAGQATAGGLELDVLLNLAPIFTGARTVPAYLWNTPFNDPLMLSSFERLWDRVSSLLAQKYGGVEFVVSVGNEVNFYLTNPLPLPGQDPLDAEDEPTEAWGNYTAFYNGAAAYIRSVPATGLNRRVGVTVTWFGCGGGFDLWLGNTDPGGLLCDGQTNTRLDALITASDVEVFTYYPLLHPALRSPAEQFAAVQDDLNGMAMVGVDQGDKHVFLQEAGHHSSFRQPGGLGVAADGTLLTEQERFVNAIFDGVPIANAQPSLGGFAPIQGFSFFHLNDFRTSPVGRFNECNTSLDCLPGTSCNIPNEDGRWVFLNAIVPPKRQDPDMTFDTLRRRALMFGGVEVPPNQPTPNGFGDVWALPIPVSVDVTPQPDWIMISTTGGPPSGNGSEAIYVPTRDQLIVITPNQDTGLREFWSLDFDVTGTTGVWTLMSPVTEGVPVEMLSYHQFGRAVYDSERERILYWGGRVDASGGPASGNSTSDLLILDLSGTDPADAGDGVVSTRVTSVPAREEFGFVFDAARNRAILFGGTGQGALLDDVWEVDFTSDPLGVDAQLQAQDDPAHGSPLPRVLFTATNDVVRERAILFGGAVPDSADSTPMNDVWELDYGTGVSWRRLLPDPDPIGEPLPRSRFGASATFAPDTGRFILFGGVLDFFSTALDDTWELRSDLRQQCLLNNPTCSSDTTCDAITNAAGLGPGILHCCTNGDLCGGGAAACVGPSACDVATRLFPSVGSCPGGQDSECPQAYTCQLVNEVPYCVSSGGAQAGVCPNGPTDCALVCDSSHRCVNSQLRAAFCSWGLIDGAGTPKDAWDDVMVRGSAFVP